MGASPGQSGMSFSRTCCVNGQSNPKVKRFRLTATLATVLWAAVGIPLALQSQLVMLCHHAVLNVFLVLKLLRYVVLKMAPPHKSHYLHHQLCLHIHKKLMSQRRNHFKGCEPLDARNVSTALRLTAANAIHVGESTFVWLFRCFILFLKLIILWKLVMLMMMTANIFIVVVCFSR